MVENANNSTAIDSTYGNHDTALAKASPLPVVVGGGVKLRDIPALAATGVAGFFVVSAVAGDRTPKKAAAGLVEAWQAACGK